LILWEFFHKISGRQLPPCLETPTVQTTGTIGRELLLKQIVVSTMVGTGAKRDWGWDFSGIFFLFAPILFREFLL